MPTVLTFGEIMLRLTTPAFQRFSQNIQFDSTLGGAEANVAVAIAGLGGSAGFLTRLPQNELGDRALADLRSLNVDVSRVVRGGDRLGVYFLEQGVSQRAGKVIYDRAHSSMATARPGDFDWATIFDDGVRWFHWSGITPALSPEAPQIIAEACAAARARGITICFDLNFRAKLWTPQRAGEVLAPLMQHVDLCVTSTDEARTVFGLDHPPGTPDRDGEAAQKLHDRFGFKTIALTQRSASSADTTEWGALLSHDGCTSVSRRHQITIVDRLGAGDSFSGALVFALGRGDSGQKAVDFAIAASALKHTIYGDFNRVSLEEVEALAAGASGGRVRR
jgi:2-dehydro-3-deoxygluconokinase